MLKILHICTQAPGRKSGGDLVVLQSSYALSKIADQVDYIGPYISDLGILAMYSKTDFLEDNLTIFQKLWSLLHFQFDRRYVSWKKKNIDFTSYDYIFIEFTKLDYILKDIVRNGYCGKVFVRAHNVEKDFLRISFEADKNIVSLSKYLLSGRREGYMLRHADVVLAITEIDKKRMIDLYGLPKEKIAICPVGVNEPVHDKVFDGKINGKLNCLITGSLWFGPNVDATAWFIDKVFPKVKDICNLTVAGFKPNDVLRKQCVQAGAELVDSPESMQPYFEKSDMVFAPIFDGAGMKVKIAEAMSYGLPVVTTTYGIIGYDVVDRANCYIAETAEEFTEAIKDYYYMTELERKEFLENTWELYVSKYSLEAIKLMVEEIIK